VHPLVSSRSSRRRTPLDRLVDALALVAGVLLCALAALVCMDVTVRTFKLFPTPWTLDIAQYMLYAITFLGAPWVLREDGHIAIEIFVERLPPGARRWVARCSDTLGAVVCALLVYYSARALWRSYTANNLVYQTFVFPEWYLYCLAPPVFLILLLLFLRRMAGAVHAAPREPPREGI
jgi:TRAP-type C4-dicarboxylate transport system permease small subunit